MNQAAITLSVALYLHPHVYYNLSTEQGSFLSFHFLMQKLYVPHIIKAHYMGHPINWIPSVYIPHQIIGFKLL